MPRQRRGAARERPAEDRDHAPDQAKRREGRPEAVARLAPDAVLLDVRLGDDDGLEACAALARARPDVSILLASDSEYEHFPDLVEVSGAVGFVRKSPLLRTDVERLWPRA